MLSLLRSFLDVLLRRSDFESDMDAELRIHREARIAIPSRVSWPPTRTWALSTST